MLFTTIYNKHGMRNSHINNITKQKNKNIQEQFIIALISSKKVKNTATHSPMMCQMAWNSRRHSRSRHLSRSQLLFHNRHPFRSQHLFHSHHLFRNHHRVHNQLHWKSPRKGYWLIFTQDAWCQNSSPPCPLTRRNSSHPVSVAQTNKRLVSCE